MEGLNPAGIPEKYKRQVFAKSPECYEVISESTKDPRSPLRCRLCALPNNSMVDIFGSPESEEDILEQIKYCLRIVVKETDTLPKQVCQPCLEELELCYKFNKIVAEAEEQLLAFDRQIGISGDLYVTKNNCQPSSLSSLRCDTTIDCDIESTSQTRSGIETKNNGSSTIATKERITDTTVRSSSVLLSLKPSSVVVSTSTNCANNCPEDEEQNSRDNEHENTDSSVDDSNSGRTSAIGIIQESACDSELSRITRSRFQTQIKQMSNTHCAEELEELTTKQYNLSVPEGACTSKTRGNSESGVGTKYYKENLTSEKDRDCQNSIDTSSEHATGRKLRTQHCSVCSKPFKYITSLETHMLRHTDESLRQCDRSKRYPREGHYRKNYSEKCKVRRAPRKLLTYQCNICAKIYRYKSYLIRHIENHSSDVRHKCKYCGKKFASRSNRDYHHLIHLKERPFECPICKKTFRQPGAVKVHSAVHIIARNYHCPICSKSFKTRQTRNKHIKIHRGLPSFT